MVQEAMTNVFVLCFVLQFSASTWNLERVLPGEVLEWDNRLGMQEYGGTQVKIHFIEQVSSRRAKERCCENSSLLT
eukprot:1140988-Pelagomonas_calceolata.AAC.1